MAEEVTGIVLAAGRSLRMGRPKALLRIGGDTFLDRAVRCLSEGGCAEVVVVVPGDGTLDREVRELGAVPAKGQPEGEQIESLGAGLAAAGAAAGAAAVLPVDHPLVRAETVAALIDRWRSDQDLIVRPVHGGRAGHPTLFPRAAWADLGRHLPGGARAVVEGRGHGRADVNVDDAGVLADIDTPEAYERWVGPT